MYDRKVLPDMTGVRLDSAISLVRFDPAKEMDILRVSLKQSGLELALGTTRAIFDQLMAVKMVSAVPEQVK